MNNNEAPIELTRIRSEAHGAYCPTCETVLGCQYWSWSKSKAMHESGTGHKVAMFKVVAK